MSGNPGRVGPGRRRLLRLATLAAPVLLGACATLPRPGPPPRVFRLTPKTTFPEGLAAVEWSLAVSEPLAERALDTDRIALVRDGTEIAYFANAVWSDRVPSLIQILLVQSFLASGAIAAVGTDRDPLRPDYLLRSVLTAFQVRETVDGRRMVTVSLTATLLRMPRRRVVAVERFAAEYDIAARRMEAVVDAFDEALGKVLKRVVLWTLHVGEADYRRGTG